MKKLKKNERDTNIFPLKFLFRFQLLLSIHYNSGAAEWDAVRIKFLFVESYFKKSLFPLLVFLLFLKLQLGNRMISHLEEKD